MKWIKENLLMFIDGCLAFLLGVLVVTELLHLSNFGWEKITFGVITVLVVDFLLAVFLAYYPKK